MKDEVALRFPARAEHLALVRLVVTHLAEHHGAGLDLARMDDLRLAVSEACANAVEAYGRQGRAGEVLVRCSVVPGEVTVEVEDHGGGFVLDDLVPHPPVEAPERLHHEHGLGIPLMRQLADRVEFHAVEEGTTVRLVVGPERPRHHQLR
ncbi:MAG: ATP-binding protein [Acidimicrobiia bacterium]|nr:ATP-binding protein [Acidimicrobiia bacterium]